MKGSSRPINGINAWWGDLPAVQRRSYLAILAGFCAFLEFVGLLSPARGSWLAALSRPVGVLLGWGAVPTLLGIVIICGLIIREAFTEQQRVSGRVICGLALALVLLLSESRIVVGEPFGGLVGAFGAWLAGHAAPAVGQVIIWGGLGLDLLVIWRMRQRAAGLARGLSHAAAREHTAEGLTPPGMQAMPHGAPSVAVRPVTRRMRPAPPMLDHTSDARLDELRVPAYLRRKAMARSPALPTLPELPAASNAGFALPPLPRLKAKRRMSAQSMKR